MNKLGEGSYGCVFKGVFVMSDNSTNNKIINTNAPKEVSKFMIDKVEFDNEIHNTIIANTIDEGRSSMKIYGYSTLNHDDIQKIIKENSIVLKRLNSCKDTLENIYNINNIYQIIYSRYGLRLKYLKSSIPSLNAHRFIILCFNLYDGLYHYIKEKFLHFDVKENNILYIPASPSEQERILFIDFGLSNYHKYISLSPFKYLIYNYRDYSLYEPPELIAYIVIKYWKTNMSEEYCYDAFKTRYEYNISTNIHNFKYKYLVPYLYNNDEKLYDSDLKSLFKKMYAMPAKNLDNYIHKHMMYYDVYKLAFTILGLFEQYHFTIHEKNITLLFFDKILFKSLHILPEKRDKINQLCNTYKKFINIEIMKK
jgi:hypothetical protein